MGSFLEECRVDLGFKGCEKSLRRILEKQLGFEFKKVDNKLKIEQRKIKKMKMKQDSSPKQCVTPKGVMKKMVPKREPVSVSIQTQTVNHQVQAVPIVDIATMQRAQGMDEMGQVHRYRYQY